ncbi:BQ5605_C015g07856 [Microbotryum silenes-dioicae]|uniref:BQ5605_C015g07839 protein n=1 Tax=Microbotryum silenes-dioicae TaxID=796604 RepID=A0A2X0NXE6_9BASI|nr:BQ5605_C015g07839 [Microbotryum silenes-dioicae]SGY17683.1 BQ5605_C015g07856 [Microbotryum silenes-dioicae]
MTRTSRCHTSSTCQNNRREADPYSLNFVAAISRYVNTCRGISAHPHDLKALKHTYQSCSTATGPALSLYLISFYDLHARMAQSQELEADSINDWIAEQADSIIINEMKRDVMGQIAFACNRRNNAMQHRNGSCELDEGELKESGSNKYFHVTVDGVEVTHHVNDQQLDRRTELLHGTFGYAHIQNGDIAGAYNLRAYSAHQASLPRVNLQHILPTSQSDSSFTTGIKAQIYRPHSAILIASS